MAKNLADIEEDLLKNLKEAMTFLTHLEKELSEDLREKDLAERTHDRYSRYVIQARGRMVNILHLLMEEKKAVEEYDRLIEEVHKGLR